MSAERIRIDLEVDPSRIAEACAVMHEAFSIYSSGQPSGALLETPESLRAEIEGGRLVAVAIVDDRVAAMVKYTPASDGSLYFSRLSVVTAAQGQGLAGVLLKALRVHAHQIGRTGLSCHVRAAQTDNIALYEHLGMAIIDRVDKVSLTGAVIPCVRMADR